MEKEPSAVESPAAELTKRPFRFDSDTDRNHFRDLVWTTYRTLQRPMPWRSNTDPYWILVSEIMLQQTQVERVKEKFLSFIDRFPTLSDLAEAPFGEVLKMWSGLGYNRRARYLHRSAQLVVEDHDGVVPETPETLVALPGIGPNTAGSIAAFAYNRPVVFIETNIRRVFLTAFFSDVAGAIHDREILPLIEKSLCRENPREWYWALMDTGSLLPKTAVNANRRSAHYVRQSTFERSRRQLRGRIVGLVNQHQMVVAENLPAYTGFSPDDVEDALADLEREGLVRRIGKKGETVVAGS